MLILLWCHKNLRFSSLCGRSFECHLLLVNRHHRGGPRCFDNRLSGHWMAYIARHHRGRPRCLNDRLSGHPMAGQVEVVLQLLGILQLVSTRQRITSSMMRSHLSVREVLGDVFLKCSCVWRAFARYTKSILNVRSLM